MQNMSFPRSGAMSVIGEDLICLFSVSPHRIEAILMRAKPAAKGYV